MLGEHAGERGAVGAAARDGAECAMNLVKTGDLVVARVAEVLRPFGLSPAGGLVLSMLADEDRPLMPGEIRDRLLVKGPTVTGVIDSLSRAGLVRRTQHPDDRRRQLVGLTDKGRRMADRFRPAVHDAERPWLESLDEAERRRLLTLLGKVQAHLQKLQRERVGGRLNAIGFQLVTSEAGGSTHANSAGFHNANPNG